jgi:iron complex transport system substrate-binding protein
MDETAQPDEHGHAEPAWAEVQLDYHAPDGTSGAVTARIELITRLEVIHTSGEAETYPYPQYAVAWLREALHATLIMNTERDMTHPHPLTRRRFLRLLSVTGGTVLLAACGGTPAAQPTAAPTASAPAPSVAPAATAMPATTAATTRTVTDHAGRTVQLPLAPQRAVAGYTTDIDVMLVLDLPLVAGPGARGLATQPFAPYQPQKRLTNVTRITTFPEANFEQIAAVQPDCIIDSVGDHIEGRYALLSQIAPTFDYSGDQNKGWRDGLWAVARAFDREAQAEQFIANYDARAADLRARLAERMPNATFALIGAYEANTVWVSDLQMHPVKLLANDLGLRPAAVMPENSADRPNLSLERLDLLDDVNLLFLRVEPLESGEGRDRSIHDPIKASPLWQRLPAVQNGGLIEYDAELFYASPLTALAFLDTVERALLGAASAPNSTS